MIRSYLYNAPDPSASIDQLTYWSIDWLRLMQFWDLPPTPTIPLEEKSRSANPKYWWCHIVTDILIDISLDNG